MKFRVLIDRKVSGQLVEQLAVDIEPSFFYYEGKDLKFISQGIPDSAEFSQNFGVEWDKVVRGKKVISCKDQICKDCGTKFLQYEVELPRFKHGCLFSSITAIFIAVPGMFYIESIALGSLLYLILLPIFWIAFNSLHSKYVSNEFKNSLSREQRLFLDKMNQSAESCCSCKSNSQLKDLRKIKSEYRCGNGTILEIVDWKIVQDSTDSSKS